MQRSRFPIMLPQNPQLSLKLNVHKSKGIQTASIIELSDIPQNFGLRSTIVGIKPMALIVRRILPNMKHEIETNRLHLTSAITINVTEARNIAENPFKGNEIEV